MVTSPNANFAVRCHHEIKILFGLQGFEIWTHVYDIFIQLLPFCAVYGALCHEMYFIFYLTPEQVQ